MMNRRHAWQGASLLALSLLSAGVLAGSGLSADAHCLGSNRPIEGRLGLMRLPIGNGHAVHGYQVNLPAPSCAEATGADGIPIRLDGVMTVQVVPSNETGERELAHLLGETVVVAGSLNASSVPGHINDAVLADSWLLAVPGRHIGGQVAVDDGRPDPGEPAQTQAEPAHKSAEADLPLPPLPASPQPAPVPQTTHTEIAIARSDGSAAPYTPPPAQGQSDIEAGITKFFTNYYLTGQNIDPEVLRGIYATKVDYFGKTASLDDVIKEKLAYYSRWPVRSFVLQPGSLAIHHLADRGQVYEVTFNYDFKVASADKTNSGTGSARLQIDLAEGHAKIVQENGKAIALNVGG